MQLVTLDAQFEDETGAKIARVQVNAALSRSETLRWLWTNVCLHDIAHAIAAL
jgi:hypothetical protein